MHNGNVGAQTNRITLRSAAAELYALPWELTRLEDANKELAQIADCTIRYTWPTEAKSAMANAGEARREGGRILFAWSHGEDAVPCRSHLEAINAACAAMVGNEKQRHEFFQPTVDVVRHASFKAIFTKIEEAAQEGRPYSIIHLLCHGGMLADDDGVGLVFTTDDARPEGLTAEGQGIEDAESLDKETIAPNTLATLFDGADSQKPNLVLLCACLGSAMDEGSHLGSVALAFHRTGIESVVASRFLLSKMGSTLLTETIYGSLLGRADSAPTSIETAVRNARANLRVNNSSAPDYAAIQLFQNTIGWDTRPVVFRPYRGLRHFRQEDAPLFFGRTKEIKEACSDLETLIQSGKPRLLIVIGASGTGKSSLVFAGIIPRLHEKRKKEAEKAPWLDVTMRPRDGVKAVEDACAEATRQKKDLLLVVDQFEEIFTDISNEASRNALVQKLLEIAGAKESGVTVIATLRSDFLSRCGDVLLGNGIRLDSVVNDKDHQVFVSLMGRDALNEVVKGPASWTGIALDEQLVKQILDDAGQEPGALPLLQNALDELWQNRARGPDGRYALANNYQKLTTAIIKKADNIINELQDPAKIDTAKRILVQLVDMRDNASPYTRRRVLKNELRKGLVGEDVFREVLEKLTTECLIVQSENESSKQAIVEIAHEQIVRSWASLGVWLNNERERLVDMSRFAKWIETRRKYENYVLQGGELALARELRKKYENDDVLGDEEKELVQSSEEYAARIAEEERKRQAALRDALLMVGARVLLAKNEPVWASKVLLEVSSPAQTRGWFDAAIEARRKIHLRADVKGELSSDIKALMPVRPIELEQRDGKFVLLEFEAGVVLWSPPAEENVAVEWSETAEYNERANREIQPGILEAPPAAEGGVVSTPEEITIFVTNPPHPYLNDGGLLWLPRGEEKPIEIANEVRILDRSSDGERLLLGVNAKAAFWKIDEPNTISFIEGGPQIVESGGFSEDNQSIWIRSPTPDFDVFYAWSVSGWVTLGRSYSECILYAATNGRHLVTAADRAIDPEEIVENGSDEARRVYEGYIWQLARWSDLIFLGSGDSATFTPDGAQVVIDYSDSSRTVSIHALGASPESNREYPLDQFARGKTTGTAQSPDGKRSFVVWQQFLVDPEYRRLLTRLRVSNYDGADLPLELRGPIFEFPIKRSASFSPLTITVSPDGNRAIMVQEGQVWFWPVTSVPAMIDELRRINRDVLPPDKRQEYLGESPEIAQERSEKNLNTRQAIDLDFLR